MLPESLTYLTRGAHVCDLSVPFFIGMPHHPLHPAFMYSMLRMHGDYMFAEGTSAANDLFLCGTHVGTHIDSLAHVSRHLQVHGGLDAKKVQSKTEGLSKLGIETVAPIVRRGVLLNVARTRGVDCLRPQEAITDRDLDRTAQEAHLSIEPGDVALIRTGWMQHWPGPMYLNLAQGAPGVDLLGARWLSEREIFLGGSDTHAFEKVPDNALPVHCHFLVEKGIHIMEMADLEELARRRVYEFLFVALPLKIHGATGSPVRPIAIY